jgi:hypothetical protein
MVVGHEDRTRKSRKIRVEGLAKWFVTGSNWQNIDATLVAPARFATNEFPDGFHKQKPRQSCDIA